MNRNDTTTTQRTSKRLKSQLVLSYLFIIAGLIAMCSGIVTADETGRAVSIGLSVGIFGAFLGSITKLRIWWNHE